MDMETWSQWWKQRGGREIRRLLMEHWDPIGVANWREAADEYDGYIGPSASCFGNERRASRSTRGCKTLASTAWASPTHRKQWLEGMRLWNG
jgi:hypothetical protein